MNTTEHIRSLLEAILPPLAREEVETALNVSGYKDLKIVGNKIMVLTQIPDGAKKNEFRSMLLSEILEIVRKRFRNRNPEYSDSRSLSSLGGIVFPGSLVSIVVKDIGKQGKKSAGVGNEVNIAARIQSVVDEYGYANVTFVDTRGKKLNIRKCIEVVSSGGDVTNNKKADIMLRSSSKTLPISIKQVNAESWQSADKMFGARGREIIDKLVKDKVIKLIPIGQTNTRTGPVKVYKLSKEIVVEPTEEEAMMAMFGTDIFPKGGVVVQTFAPHHFEQDEAKITVDCEFVITEPKEIPQSHLMLWLLRNDSSRNSGALGIAGIRPVATILSRGLGTRGNKDVVLVDKSGKVVDNPNAPSERTKRGAKAKEEPKPMRTKRKS